MRKFRLEVNSCPEEIRAGLAEIVAEYPKRFARAKRIGVALTFEKDPR